MHKKINSSIAVVVLIIAQILYLLTMAPTFSFWDCGEFIATAYTLGVPHPPGAPFFLIVGRLFSMIPFFEDIGARVNLISTISSSVTVMLTYLIIVRFIILYRDKNPNDWSLSEKISAYGSGVVGSLALAFSDSFWFNAVETEVYAASIFFTAIVIWLILKWNEEADQEGNERWLMVLMYMMGLSIGVHLLNLLAIFAIALVYYYHRYEVNVKSFIWLIVISSGLFFLIYPGIIKFLPALMNSVSPWIAVVAAAGLGYAIYYTQKERMRIMNTIVVSLFLIVLGYTTYTVIFIRAQADPPINENAPTTMKTFHSYLNREQYGDLPLWPRRWSSDPTHQRNYSKYDSEFDYFWNYQLVHMYARYFGWQFIGRAGDVQDSGVDWSKLWGLPFVLGMFGMYHHFRRQWTMGLVVGALFMVTGFALILYLNQTEPQPRERDYSYVGSFFAFAIWIGIGIDGLFEALRESFRDEKTLVPGAAALCLCGLLFVDGRMLQVNYYDHSRANNYSPWDYAYNLLQSCDKDAVLFTNGDNDTFPLWYLQEVARIRTDVRVVNLSLANTDWYILQLKNESPRGAKKVKFRLSDDQIRQLSYMRWDAKRISLPVPQNKITPRGDLITSETDTTDIHAPKPPAQLVDKIEWTFSPAISVPGRSGEQPQGFIRAQDVVVYEVVANNIWERPVYFAITVSESNMIGLNQYLRLDGLAYKIVPVKSSKAFDYVEPDILYGKLMNTFQYRNLGNEDVYYEETTRRMVSNYKNIFMRLAAEYATSPNASSEIKTADGSMKRVQNKDLAIKVLDKAEEILPNERYEIDYRLLSGVISLYANLGENSKARALLPELQEKANQYDSGGDPRPKFVLAQAYKEVGAYEQAEALYQELYSRFQDPMLKQELNEIRRTLGRNTTGNDASASESSLDSIEKTLQP
ncbi:conserved hypothetical protein [Chloroherpeton thalassium ATCC 35110]|uniref:DUF2723 domain-containing protein n=1 Tax=Chloroherpeton thalassium (strain ATCC 35110 / GB-78) TaxID=517418 RepID=B3QWD0_CHLT3|nr:DUF2723 domain-containing protein [Chloroherpeton thalassium]ACF13243.1 conserved hypothetical protein [Chloroherpeton thalassium ATCC 35110]